MPHITARDGTRLYYEEAGAGSAVVFVHEYAGDWRTWLVCAGRGFGKTRIGAEWVRESVQHFKYVNVIGATSDDARDVMIQGSTRMRPSKNTR